jgi:hypothetical protein
VVLLHRDSHVMLVDQELVIRRGDLVGPDHFIFGNIVGQWEQV